MKKSKDAVFIAVTVIMFPVFVWVIGGMFSVIADTTRQSILFSDTVLCVFAWASAVASAIACGIIVSEELCGNNKAVEDTTTYRLPDDDLFGS